MTDDVDWPALRDAAREARVNAYAPYSRYLVGAALLADDGRVFKGVNVENASYGLAQCAERTAVGAAIVAGARRFRGIAIVTEGASPATPCGMCRQVLSEFPPSFPVRCYTTSGVELVTSVAELLPASFGPSNLDPTQKP